MVWRDIFQAETTEPTVGQVQVHFLAYRPAKFGTAQCPHVGYTLRIQHQMIASQCVRKTNLLGE